MLSLLSQPRRNLHDQGQGRTGVHFGAADVCRAHGPSCSCHRAGWSTAVSRRSCSSSEPWSLEQRPSAEIQVPRASNAGLPRVPPPHPPSPGTRRPEQASQRQEGNHLTVLGPLATPFPRECPGEDASKPPLAPFKSLNIYPTPLPPQSCRTQTARPHHRVINPHRGFIGPTTG